MTAMTDTTREAVARAIDKMGLAEIGWTKTAIEAAHADGRAPSPWGLKCADTALAALAALRPAQDAEGRMLNTWALLDEAASDPTLSDSAFRLLVKGRWATVTPDDEKWARAVLQMLAASPPRSGESDGRYKGQGNKPMQKEDYDGSCQ